jgi:hypothetical protein
VAAERRTHIRSNGDFMLDLLDFLIKYPARLMKIAQCLEYPLGLRGGVSVLVETLTEQLAQRGHKIVLVSPDTPETLRESGANKFIDQHIYWELVLNYQRTYCTAMNHFCLLCGFQRVLLRAAN